MYILLSSFYFLCHQCKREGFVQKIKDEAGEGCNIHGSLEVNKVAGNFHFAAGKSFHLSNFHLQDLIAFQAESYNVRLNNYMPIHLEELIQYLHFIIQMF